jgi:hypothetical protein
MIAISILLLCSMAAGAKDRKKLVLPNDILEARTVLVIIDPKAGTAVDAPLANQTARDDVEQALTKWGRFELVNDLSIADLVISVRKGNGKIAQPTIGDVPDNNRPVIFQPNASGGRVGVSHGTPPMATGPNGSLYPNPSPEIEAGPTQDMLSVFRGKRDDPTDSPAVWRYEAKGALRSPGVPAVDEFKNLINEAEKQRANNP